MQIESIRKSTFTPTPAPSRSASGKRATTTKSKSQQQSLPAWPYTAASHPNLTPSTLARAGYYYAPDSPISTDGGEEADEDDQCCCFTCGKKLGGWDSTDDPFVEHWKRSADAAASGSGEIACAWATAVCSAVVHVKKVKDGSSSSSSSASSSTAEAGTRKRGKTTQPPSKQLTNTQPRPHIYPRVEAHLHPRSELMNKAREQTYYPSAHLLQLQLQQKEDGKSGKEGKIKEGKGWWPHKVKRAWLCTVPNLAKAGFVYTPTVEEDDCVTCFYCNYSVSDWEPVDDPWKQHYDKSPNCPFFTETVEGDSAGNEEGNDVLDKVDLSDEDVSELPTTVRSKAAAGSKRPTSRSISATTKARRTTAAPPPLPPPRTLTKSTTRSRIPKTTAGRSDVEAPATSRTTSREVSDDENEKAEEEQQEVKAGKGRPKRATMTTAKASTKTTKTPTTRKATRRTTKATTVESADEVPEDPTTTAGEDEDTGVDELDALPPRSTQSRVKASTRGTTTTAAAKKSTVPRKPAGRAAKAKPIPVTENSESLPTESAQSVASSTIAASDVEMASSQVTATENEQSETEKEESLTDVEEQRREYLAEEETVKSHRMQMVEVGAREAMAVMQNLGSKRLDTVRALTRDESATPRAVSSKRNPGTDNNDEKLSSFSTLRNDHDSEVIELTADEERLTVVEYVRRMYARRREALLGAGEAKIADWEEKAGQARAFIESIPTRS